MDELNNLQLWFKSVCDGEWEHGFGITIQTLDNPGWAIHINLLETTLELCEFIPIKVERTEQDWLHCKVEDGQFAGYCGVENLVEILGIFTSWVKRYSVERSVTDG